MCCIVKEIWYKLDINIFYCNEEDKMIGMNDIVCVVIWIIKLFYYDVYCKNCIIGSVIFVDEGINEIVGVGMII